MLSSVICAARTIRHTQLTKELPRGAGKHTGGNVRLIFAWGAVGAPALVFALLGSSFAQPMAPVGQAFVRPNVAAVRIDPSEAPTIDGDVSDAVWAKANVIDRFIQKSPNPGQPATERTVVRILYDANNLYFSFYNYDANPDRIIVRSMQRDGPLFTADSVAIYLDPGQTRRNAYNFEIGASGGRTDQLELNNTEELREWDTIWEARSRRVADGWTAEFAIPFRSLSYDTNQTTWGFDVSRRVRHKNERLYWSGFSPNLEFTDVSQSGDLTGISNVTQGLGLDVQVYGKLGGKHDWGVPGDGADLAFTVGGNAFYKVTPALTNTLTINTDFSDAPLDVRQVNTTRFSLFTPETRDFFLQDIAAFEFGGRNFGRNSQDRVSNNGRPFFSRNIGISGGQPVNIVVGDKLSGQLGGFDIGALSVLTADTPTSSRECVQPLNELTRCGELLSVLRVTHPVLSESKVGFIVTNGDPSGLTENTVAGIDLQYRNSDFFGRYILQGDAYYQRSFSNTFGEDDSAAVSLNFPNEPWFGDFVFKQIGTDFTPALGFVNRTSIRQYTGTVSHLARYRNTYLNQFEIGTNFEYVTDLDDRLESRVNDVYVRLASAIGDEVTARIINTYENVPALFFLPRKVPVLPGRYEWNSVAVRVRTFDGRQLRLDSEVTCCGFFDGTSLRTRVILAYRPNAYFEFIPTYDGTFIRMPTGNVDIHLFSVDSVINFTPDMQIAMQLQYDNISANFGFSARYRWEYEPGNEIFIGVAQAAIIPGLVPRYTFIPRMTQVSLRLGHTFRF